MIKPHLWGNSGPAAIEFIYWSFKLNITITSYDQLSFLLETKYGKMED